MDIGGIVAAHAPGAGAGMVIALLAALFSALARSQGWMRERAQSAAAENEALRDEVWRLKEAASARDRAEAASRAKSRFLATMSHEIRTPLNGILGVADLLARGGLSPENASYVEAIRGSGVALVALVDQILDLSRMEAGRLDLAVEPLDLVRLVEGVVELLAPRAQMKGLEIAASIAASTPRFVMADPTRLRQVLLNLAGNAIKFTATGGVCVAVDQRAGEGLRFAVVDTGPGVAADRREAIFRDFEQGDGPPSVGRQEGAGLGLAISRQLVELMGGRLEVDENPGGGSVFCFTVRLPPCEDAARRPEAEPVSLAGARALIIARSPFEAPAIAMRLVEAGATVVRAEGLESGLAALARPDRPDLVIVDCALGPEATNRLAEAAKAAGAPRSLVLFSPFERRAFGQISLQGFDGWLVKPVRARSLYERLAAEFPPAREPSAVEPQNRPMRRALIAEDNDINALIAEKALGRLGFETVRATDGDDAVRLASPLSDPGAPPPFDLILMDLKMPGLDGVEATRRLRLQEAAAGALHTPIVALTASAPEDERRACLAAGADAFLVKPFDFDHLASAVGRLCGSNRTPAGRIPKAS
jgi:signal transduction histidine kinase/CheY-like chemotaxis protein